MTFKMKGSAFKLNNVATKSALKQAEVSPMKKMGKYQTTIDELTGETIVTQIPREKVVEEGGTITTGKDIKGPPGLTEEQMREYELDIQRDRDRKKSMKKIAEVGKSVGITDKAKIMEQEIQNIVDNNAGLSPGDEGYIEMTPKQKEFQQALTRRLTMSRNK